MLPRLPVPTDTIVLPTNCRLHLTAGAEYTYSYGGTTAYDPQSPRRRVVPHSRLTCRLPRVSLTRIWTLPALSLPDPSVASVMPGPGISSLPSHVCRRTHDEATAVCLTRLSHARTLRRMSLSLSLTFNRSPTALLTFLMFCALHCTLIALPHTYAVAFPFKVFDTRTDYNIIRDASYLAYAQCYRRLPPQRQPTCARSLHLPMQVRSSRLHSSSAEPHPPHTPPSRAGRTARAPPENTLQLNLLSSPREESHQGYSSSGKENTPQLNLLSSPREESHQGYSSSGEEDTAQLSLLSSPREESHQGYSSSGEENTP